MREDKLFTRPTIELRSINEVHRWYFALWIASIVALSTVASVAIAWPLIVERVNNANQEDVS